MARKGDPKLYEFVDALVATGAREMVASLGTDEATAKDLMRGIAHSICLQYARSYMYVPVDMEFELSLRDKEIWRKYGEDSARARKFTSARVAELSEEYGVTTVQIYCIVRLMKQREFADRQGTLPLDDEPGQPPQLPQAGSDGEED